MLQPLSTPEIEEQLLQLPQWQYENHQLVKTWRFSDFRVAMSFLMQVAFEAEALNHHPEIWNVYNQVKLSLTTHDVGNKVTELDVLLAKAIERRMNDLGF